jgi:F-type H+-transporting ATPase subunit delta
MKETKVATRYAKSLIGLAKERNELDAAFQDMEVVLKACQDSKDLRVFLNSPVVNADKKKNVLSSIFAGKIGTLSSGFIQIITSKGREYLLSEIASEFIRQYKVSKNITEARVTSAVPLDSEVREKILALIHKTTTGEVEINEVVDPEIIGGLVVQIGDKQVDASIRKKLNELKKEFSKNLYVPEL